MSIKSHFWVTYLLFLFIDLFSEKIQTNIVAKAIEAEGPFAVDITDVFPIGKESCNSLAYFIISNIL